MKAKATTNPVGIISDLQQRKGLDHRQTIACEAWLGFRSVIKSREAAPALSHGEAEPRALMR